MKEKVSIIIPAYNAEKYIKRTIESVINQTYKNIEIIIVNDGSVDNTLDVVNKCKEKDSRIIILSKKNGGVSEARNEGLKCANGDYICFLDSDDEYEKKFVEEMYSSIVESNADIVVCGYKSIFDNGEELLSKLVDNTLCLDKKNAIEHLIIGNYISSHPWNKIYKREIFHDLKFPVGQVYEDTYIMPSIIERCERVAIIPKTLVRYNQIGDSISHIKSVKNEKDAYLATVNRYNLYKNDYKELMMYLVREPIEIALRLIYMKKKSEDDKKEYIIIRKDLRRFLWNMCIKKESYMKLRYKYKIALCIYPIVSIIDSLKYLCY